MKIIWERVDGEYWSKDNRFSIAKATGQIHSGDWKLLDWHTKQEYYKPTLKECKHIAEIIISTN